MKILFVTGSRGEWGYIKPIINLCIKKSISYNICATNMMLLPNYGKLIDEIKKQGYNVTDEIFMSLEGDNHFSMTKSLSVFLSSFIDIIKRIKPTWIVLAGDRGEQLMASIGGSYTYTPTAHIQAGERSGNIDGLARHAIGKFSHVHFASNIDAKNRLLALGEEKFRIFNVGAPQLDEIKNCEISSKKKIEEKYNLSLKKKFILILFHPVTEEFDKIENQTNILIDSIKDLKENIFWVFPNNDAGANKIKNKIISERKDNIFLFENLSRRDFLCLMKYCIFMIGNSSSGLLEAPSFKKPAINIGRRQDQRIRAQNVIDCKFNKNQIKRAINKAQSNDFLKKIKNIKNPYGNGDSSEKILKVLKKIKINDKLMIKKITI
ncbi:MAG: UDP-N-acetylglucosamine 2-epimerase (hydrolyzing) [Candidatus Endolissoclinum sp. TMED37]|nr:MAG: UDP-N-acetylglucosamine 2-epimerase (hydrolyzing) [Candidatus Endolissoclinum sp. TMED37]|tara:strand:- start:1624 stop:2757 length:1134 start_codon:yes stop_codon:yes gene_type:complete